MFRRLLVALCFATIVVAGATAQENGSAVSLNVAGAFTTNNGGYSTGNSLYFASFEHSFATHSAVQLNYGFLEHQNFGLSDGSALAQANAHELTAAYMLKLPRGKFVPFFTVGGGALIFSPNSNYFLSSTDTPSTQAKAAFLYGAGFDYNVSKNIAFRMQYRGLTFKTPDLSTVDLNTGTTSHIAEPSVGVVFHF